MVSYRQPEHVSALEKESANGVTIPPEHGLKYMRQNIKDLLFYYYVFEH